MTYFLGVLAGIIGIVGYVPYVRDIIKGTTKPDRASWLIWALQYSVLFLAQAAQHAGSLLWLVGLQLLCTLVVYALSFRYGVGRLHTRSALLLVCVCLAMLAWYFTKNAGAAIVIALSVEFTGVILTALKAYKQPGSETPAMWLLLATAGLIGGLAVGRGAALILYLYPTSLVIIGLGVVGASWLGGRHQRSKTPHSHSPSHLSSDLPTLDSELTSG